MNNKPTYLSKEGLEKLRAELDEMVSVKRPEVAQRIHDAKEHGDLSENAEYEDAKNEQAFVEGRIQTLQALIKNATIIDENHSTDHVQIGSTVAVESDDGKESFTIVGLDRGQADRGPDQQREPRRARPARQEEGREGPRQGPGRRLHLQDRLDQLATPRRSRLDRPPSRHRHGGVMDWADELAASVSGPQVVNDSKTPSGTVHLGSLRGPVILDTIWRALRARGLEAQLLYGVDDYDPMDAQALLTPDAVGREMGRPLFQVPDPVGDCHQSYARHFAGIFIDTFSGLGIHPERYYWMSDIYPTGDVDPFIRIALDRAATVREIYRRVANVQHPDAWHPLQVVCENCGKIGTTIVTDWDGDRVFYECREQLVTWARGCGHSGWTSPFGGRAKLPWNLEWAAQWSLFGVTIEPCGKDLSTAGGSRDRSDAIAREVFEREPPLNVPYEFINIGGKKMSTSKGLGAAAHEIVDVIKPEQLRFFFLRPKPNHAVDFDPVGTDAIPRLYDEFDRFAAATAGKEVRGEIAPGFENTFRYALLDPAADAATEAARFRPAFGHLSLLLQVPNVDVAERVEAEKGSALDEREQRILDERVDAARGWLASYAPDKAVIVVRRDALPAEAAELDDAQRRYLAALADAVESETPTAGDAWQDAIFRTATDAGLEARAAFTALYLAFLGRANGPRAGWLLASLDPAFVVDRLRQAARAPVGGAA